MSQIKELKSEGIFRVNPLLFKLLIINDLIFSNCFTKWELVKG